MARPQKWGLDYFPFDVDFFEDAKLSIIRNEFGSKGEIVAVKLLCAVYHEGYYMEWNEQTRVKLYASVSGLSAQLFDQVVNCLVKWGFFDKTLFDSAHVLTSHGIQKRYSWYSEAIFRYHSSEGSPFGSTLFVARRVAQGRPSEKGTVRVYVCRNATKGK